MSDKGRWFPCRKGWKFKTQNDSGMWEETPYWATKRPNKPPTLFLLAYQKASLI